VSRTVDRDAARAEAHRLRYEMLDRRNARRHGTEEQYRELVRQQGSQELARQERREERRELRQDRREDRRDWRDDRRESSQDWREDWRDDRREYRQDSRQWNRNWQRDRRYDWRGYRDQNRHIFRVRPYYAPYRGYGYNRFSIGMILDRLFWGQNYWISDPWQYRLPPAPYGYQWVRYYNDVVLVDTYSGRIVDVIHDFFW
jgi:Ni/Co efflux regulator RcnB